MVSRLTYILLLPSYPSHPSHHHHHHHHHHHRNHSFQFLNTLGGRGDTKGGGAFVVNPYSCVVVGAARSTQERQRNLSAFRNGDFRFLICTDAAARGIDINGLPYVINMTLPEATDYIHRVGRVGRAGRLGLAISLVSAVEEKVWFCTKKGYKPWLKPTKEDVRPMGEGGHTIWYHELQLLADAEKRLGGEGHAESEKVVGRGTIARLEADLSLPAEVLARAETRGGVYGERVGEEMTGAEGWEERLASLLPSVERLEELEVQAQLLFFQTAG